MSPRRVYFLTPAKSLGSKRGPEKAQECQYLFDILPQRKVVGLLTSAHRCVRPSLLDFFFSDPLLPVAVVLIIVVIVGIVKGSRPLTN